MNCQAAGCRRPRGYFFFEGFLTGRSFGTPKPFSTRSLRPAVLVRRLMNAAASAWFFVFFTIAIWYRTGGWAQTGRVISLTLSDDRARVRHVHEPGVGRSERDLRGDGVDVLLEADDVLQRGIPETEIPEHLARIDADRHGRRADDELDAGAPEVVHARDARRVGDRNREHELVGRERDRLLDEPLAVERLRRVRAGAREDVGGRAEVGSVRRARLFPRSCTSGRRRTSGTPR